MNKTLTIWLVLAACVAVFAMTSAVEAKRMGGGKSMGQQNTTVTKQAQPPAKPQAAPAPVAAATPASRPWGAMLGGMAAGLGLAWLAHSLGFSEAFGNILLAILIGGIAIAALGWFLRRRQITQEPQPNLGEQRVL